MPRVGRHAATIPIEISQKDQILSYVPFPIHHQFPYSVTVGGLLWMEQYIHVPSPAGARPIMTARMRPNIHTLKKSISA